MKVSLNWLKRYVDLDGRSAEDLSNAFTLVGFEVEGVHRTGLAPIAKVVVGEVLSRDPHPNADKLSVCQVRYSELEPATQIVCGAQNYTVGDRVPVALPGAVLPGDFKIKVSKIRGVESNGMLCSARELGLGDDHGGLLILTGRPALGLPIDQALGSGDTIFDLEITPNRPDALCHLGLARELAAWFRTPLRYPEISLPPPSDSSHSAALVDSVSVEADQACPLYTLHALRGVKIGPSPAWLQEALKAVGLRPINSVVDVTNFVLLETGQPLHAFDAAKIRGKRIIVRYATAGETMTTLDGKPRTLAANHLTIRDAERPLVIAGIMGGVDAEVDESTTDILLESAYFAPQIVRRAARQLGLSSDSSYRFERGVDPQGVAAAARRAIQLILEIAGGTWVAPALQAGSAPVWQREIQLRPGWIRSRAGFDLPDDLQKELLQRLELDLVREETDDAGQVRWSFSVPSWRGDLDREVDLLEEVIRLHGTENIPSGRVAFGSIVDEDDGPARFVVAAASQLAARGFQEAINYTLRPSGELGRWVPAAAAADLRLANPLAEEQSHLRHSLLPGLLDTLLWNQARQSGAQRFFETGRVFHDIDGIVQEMVSVAFVIHQPDSARSWKGREAEDYFTARQTIVGLAQIAGIEFGSTDFRPVRGSNSAWQAGHSAESGSFPAGCEARYGLLSLAMTRALGLEGPVVAGSIDFQPHKLPQRRERSRYKPVSAFPVAHRDLALVVDETLPAAEVQRSLLKIARAAAGQGLTVEKAELFDVYTGPGLAAGKRSLAFALGFRAADRTLTDEEVNAVFTRLQTEVEKAGFAVRK